MFKKTLLEQFRTNKFERKGILCLVGLIVVTIVVFRFIDNPKTKKEKTDPALVTVLEEYYAKLPKEKPPKQKKFEFQNKKSNRSYDKKNPAPSNKIILSKFDPNVVDYHGLLTLGFTSKQANTLIKFRKSGFEFRAPEDLAKVYGIDEELINRLRDYMLFTISEKELLAELTPPKDTIAIQKEIKKPFKKIELNTATLEDLTSIYGIGNIYAGIILKYRNRLGGYQDLTQISEPYSFPDSTMLILTNALTIDTMNLIKLNVNEVSFKELLSHPYITYEDNRILFPFIESRRPITDLNVLDGIMVLDTAVISKIKPYLKIE